MVKTIFRVLFILLLLTARLPHDHHLKATGAQAALAKQSVSSNFYGPTQFTN